MHKGMKKYFKMARDIAYLEWHVPGMEKVLGLIHHYVRTRKIPAEPIIGKQNMNKELCVKVGS